MLKATRNRRESIVGREKISHTGVRTRDSLNLVRVRYCYATQPVVGRVINSNILSIQDEDRTGGGSHYLLIWSHRTVVRQEVVHRAWDSLVDRMRVSTHHQDLGVVGLLRVSQQ
jgi:hypothetical protein